MKNLPRILRIVAVLAGVFALGVLFNRSAIPFLSREVKVWVIQGVEGRGCEGSWGATEIRFGQGMGQVDGEYKIPCDKVSLQSDTFALQSLKANLLAILRFWRLKASREGHNPDAMDLTFEGDNRA